MQLDIHALTKLSRADLFKKLFTTETGLTDKEAHGRLQRVGHNDFQTKKKIRPFEILLSKFKSPLLLLLTGAAILSAFLGSTLDAIIILVVVGVSGVVDFYNTFKSEKAVQELESQVRITVEVERDGQFVEKQVRDLVPGDIISLGAGDLVPADSILLDSKDLFVNESVVTGESLPVEKGEPGLKQDADQDIIWMGTTIVSGECTVLVVETGTRTRVGTIAERLQTNVETASEFDKNLRDFSAFIFRLTLVLVGSILIINIFFLHKDTFSTFFFAVAIAVGIAPELLPMIVTANLTRGAVQMSKKGVIVRNLSAIHNFGSIDTLCTDKTGTLTEDKITLIKYTDGVGSDNDDVLFWGAMSSHYVTSIRRTLDAAIREYKPFTSTEWQKVDEIPFDFQRKVESIAVQHKGRITLITKGAPEDIIASSLTYDHNVRPLDAALRQQILNYYTQLSTAGFRVIGLAIKDMGMEVRRYTKQDESNLTFLGFLAFMDPAKKSVKETLALMQSYNVAIRIITGDNHLVAKTIAMELNLPVKGVLTGDDLKSIPKESLAAKIEQTTIFSRVTPDQKEMIVETLRTNGHVVGYMGDGVNDVLALKAADVGISVNNATQIAKETADIILLRKGLDVLIDGVLEGRKTFANTFKYLMMALSSNFGNMFSIPISSIFLPFLPMTPTQIILNNFLYDSSQFAISFDNVEEEFLKKPKKFNLGFMKRFMLVFGPLSSFFDFITFMVLYYGFHLINGSFQTGWFLVSLATQALVVLVIRSRSTFGSKPHPLLLVSAIAVTVGSWLLPFIPSIGRIFGFQVLPFPLLGVLAAIVVAYLIAVHFMKLFFYKRWGHLIEG